ncbi:MAG: DUF6089 family protein [Ferruginibacter sp.]
MKRIVIIYLALSAAFLSASAQYENIQLGDFGITAGAAHYFGDLNTRAAVNRPKPVVGIFFRKQFSNYIGMRVSAHYAQLGYSDVYSKNEYQVLRNLSFNSNIWELAVHGDFNFFKYIPSDLNHLYTPYITLGVGVFSYDPYAFYDGQRQFLRPLGTEGQTSGYMGRKEYGSMALCVPFGVGFKYSLTDKMNFSIEVSHRFTTTDYLDDVSTTYAGADKFPDGPDGASLARLLQDRSYEIDPVDPIGIEGRQRGFSKQKDQYLFAELGISFNISSYRCPTAR